MAGYGPPPIVPGSSTLQCIVKVQLNISCKNLLDKDVMSKSDPMTVISMFNSRSSSWLEVCYIIIFKYWVFLELYSALQLYVHMQGVTIV